MLLLMTRKKKDMYKSAFVYVFTKRTVCFVGVISILLAGKGIIFSNQFKIQHQQVRAIGMNVPAGEV